MRHAQVHAQRISVPFEYPVYFTERIFSPENPDLRDAVSAREPGRRHRMLVVVDGGVADAWPRLGEDIAAYAAAHAGALSLAGEPVIIPGGEACKNDPAVAEGLWARLDALGIDRHSFVVIVGGGAVLDAAGWAAATCHRGVRVIRVPTTVLGQADSGVGVKCGVNAFGKKNFLGTFAPPWAVLVDRAFLETLPRRDGIAGMAEAVKVALIRDASFFTWMEQHAAALADLRPGPLSELVRRSAELHLRHIAQGGDPFELGSARPLDFGHWSAHKLEALTEHRLRHGEAVAIGMALDVIYSELAGLCPPDAARRVLALIERLGLPMWDDALDLGARGSGGRVILRGLEEFREHLGGELTITLLAGIGRGVEVHAMDPRMVEAAVEELRRGARSASAAAPARATLATG